MFTCNSCHTRLDTGSECITHAFECAYDAFDVDEWETSLGDNICAIPTINSPTATCIRVLIKGWCNRLKLRL